MLRNYFVLSRFVGFYHYYRRWRGGDGLRWLHKPSLSWLLSDLTKYEVSRASSFIPICSLNSYGGGRVVRNCHRKSSELSDAF